MPRLNLVPEHEPHFAWILLLDRWEHFVYYAIKEALGEGADKVEVGWAETDIESQRLENYKTRTVLSTHLQEH